MDELLAVISRINLLTINDEEARQLSGEHSLVKAAKVIHEMGPEFLIIKKGEHGALLFHGEDIFLPLLCHCQKYLIQRVQEILLPEDLWDTLQKQMIFLWKT